MNIQPDTMTQPVWSHPPIVEAGLYIQAVLPAFVNLTFLEQLQDNILDRYPNKEPRATYRMGFEASHGEPPQVSSEGGQDGFYFSSADGQKVVQAHRDGFAFSRLRGYETWEIFSEEARELWGRYREIAQPESVLRIGLRDINRLTLPLPVADFKEYLLTVPEIAPGVPQALLSYFMRVVIPKPEIEALGIVIEAMDPPTPNGDAVSIVFDIDVFKQRHYEASAQAIWADFSHLREFKNEIFYNSLTDKVKAMFV